MPAARAKSQPQAASSPRLKTKRRRNSGMLAALVIVVPAMGAGFLAVHANASGRLSGLVETVSEKSAAIYRILTSGQPAAGDDLTPSVKASAVVLAAPAPEIPASAAVLAKAQPEKLKIVIEPAPVLIAAKPVLIAAKPRLIEASLVRAAPRPVELASVNQPATLAYEENLLDQSSSTVTVLGTDDYFSGLAAFGFDSVVRLGHQSASQLYLQPVAYSEEVAPEPELAVAHVIPASLPVPDVQAAPPVVQPPSLVRLPFNPGLPLDRAVQGRNGQATLYDGGLTAAEFITKEKRCLSNAIYFEARGEPIEGQLAVAQTILNRVRSDAYPNTVCSVVYQGQQRHNRCQFSFACDGIPDRTNERAQWELAQDLASRVADGKVWLPEVGFATHYHADYVRPSWLYLMHRLARVGRHIFYRGTFLPVLPPVVFAEAPKAAATDLSATN